jgi:hypothetical protein
MYWVSMKTVGAGNNTKFFPTKNIISYRRVIQKQAVLLEDSYIGVSNLLKFKI